MSGAPGDKKVHHIAQQRAQHFKKVRQEPSITRARSQDGQPVAYQKVKEEANIMRRSKVMSDPDIPSSLVILNAKGLFQGKNGSQSASDIRPASVNIMDKESRPVFFDSSVNSKKAKVSDLRKRFEAVEHDIGGSNVVNTGGDFLNPLHKVNQDSASSVRTKLQESVQQKPDGICSGETESIEYQSEGKQSVNRGSDSLNVLHKVSQDLSLAADDKSKKNVQKKFEKVLGNLDVCVKKPIPPPKSNNVLIGTSSEPAVKSPPSYPPPRPPTRDPLKRCRGESDPMPVDENQVSWILHVTTYKSLEENIQEENVPQQSLETNDAVNGTETNEHSSSGENVSDDDDDDDDDDWDTDFDDSYDDDEVGGVCLKRDSQLSYGSSCDVEPLEFPDAMSKKLYNIASEILTTERAYVRRLHLLDQVFRLRLDNECCAKGILPAEAINDIFSNIEAIHQLHREFLLPKLEARMKEWSTNNQIGDILKGLAPFLKMYTLYVGNFDKATEMLSTWMKKSSTMTAIIDEIQKSKECENLTLQHHMLEPVQRVPRYQLLLKDYLSKLPEDSKDLKNTSDALEIIAESARHANDSMKKTERFKILLEIQEKIGVDYPLITASRELVMEGEFKKVAARTSDSHQERTLMLFNDVLLCCAKFPGTNKYKVKVEMDLYGMEVDTVDEDLEMENAFRITSKQRVMDFTAPTAEAKEAFMDKLRETVNELTNKRESYKRGHKIEVMKEGDLGKKAPAWVRDEAVSMCMLCDVMFTRFRRRHHCRACGRVVCGNCSSFKAALEYKNGKLEKVCEVCHKILVKGSSEENAKESKVKGNSILKIGSDSKIWHSGYLSYKTKGDKGWQKRWFVLSSDFVLYRYKAKKDMKAEYNLPLPGYNVDKPTLADEVDRKNVFKVHHKNFMVFWFQAESEESMNRWIELLTHATKAEQIDEEQPTGEKKIQRANSA